MQRRSEITGLVVEDLRVLHKTVGMLSDPERGADMRAVGTDARRVTSWRTRTASLRLKFVIVPSIYFDEIKSAMMSSSQG